jgi:outer membrane protein OmpA-like peptidoglycan-associated protein
MEANTDTTVNVLNKARLWEQDRQSNQLIPGPEDSADVTIKPLPAWTVTSKASPETVFVAVEKTTLENLGADSFISGSAVLTDVVQAQLFRVRDRLLSAPTQNIIITGHTDSNPINTPQYPNNFVLSMARANALRQWLIAAGIDSNRIIPRGFGPTKPVASNKTADGRRQNRRVELELVETVVDRVPYKSEITRTTTVSYHGAETLSQVEVVDSLGMNTTYLPDSATSMPLVSPGMLRWLLNDVRPGDAFTVTYKIEASGVASGNIPFRIPTVVSFSLPDGQWITNAPVTGKDVILMPKVDEEMPGQREDEGGARE